MRPRILSDWSLCCPLLELYACRGPLHSKSYWMNSTTQKYECSQFGSPCCRPTWALLRHGRWRDFLISEPLNIGTRSILFRGCLANGTVRLWFGIMLLYIRRENCGIKPHRSLLIQTFQSSTALRKREKRSGSCYARI